MADLSDAFRSVLTDVDKLISDISPFSPEEKGEQRRLLEKWRDMFDSPCRLAVGGAIKQGKSSLVNAMLGHDWSAVGCTETTGTICVMTNKVALQINRPVCCVRHDGTSERWVSLQEAEQMQGIERKQLEEAQGIRWLEYALGQLAPPFLADFELVDTPGVCSADSTGGQTHDSISHGFIKEVDALVLVVRNTMDEMNRELLEAFYSNRSEAIQSSGSGVYIVRTNVDRGCATVEEMEEKKKQLTNDIRNEAILNYGFQESTRVFCVSSTLESKLTCLGADGMKALYTRLRPSYSSMREIPREERRKLLEELGDSCQMIVDSIFRYESYNEVCDVLHAAAGVQELREYIIAEMRNKKLLYRLEHMTGELLRYFQYDYARKIQRYNDILVSEREDFTRFCAMVDSHPEFSRGQLGALLQQVKNSFSQTGISDTEEASTGIVGKLQRIRYALEILRLREDVNEYYYVHQQNFSQDEINDIELLCERNGQVFRPVLSYVQNRYQYWRNMKTKIIYGDFHNVCAKLTYIYGRYVVLLGDQ